MVHFSEHIQQLHFITQRSSSPGPLLWGLHTTHRIHTFVMMVLFWSWSGETKLGKGGDRSGNIDGCLMTGWQEGTLKIKSIGPNMPEPGRLH